MAARQAHNLKVVGSNPAPATIFLEHNMLTVGGNHIVLGGDGSGDVVGPASSTDNAIARFDGTTGNSLQDSSVTISDAGAIKVNGIIDSTGSAGSVATPMLGSVGGLVVWQAPESILKFQGGARNVDIGSGNTTNTGNYNTNSGFYGLHSNTTGIHNTNSGGHGLYSNTTGNYNTNSGVYGLYSNTTGSHNTNSGRYGLRSNTTGNYNTNSGVYGLYSNTTGNYNSRLGYGNEGITTGSCNTILGANVTVPATAENLVVLSNGAGTGLTTYADNAAAVAAGLVTGCLWKRADPAGGFQVMIVG